MPPTPRPLHFYPVTKDQFNYVQSFTHGLNKADYKLFCHLLISFLEQFRQIEGTYDGWLPVTGRFIQSHFRCSVDGKMVPARMEHLVALNLIKFKPHHHDSANPKKGRARCFKVQDWVLDGFLESFISGHQADINLPTHKPLRKEETNTYFNTHANVDKQTPALLRRALGCLKVCYYDLEGVLLHITQLKAQSQSNPSSKNRRRLIHDWASFQTLQKSSYGPHPDYPGIIRFKPRYQIQSTGRVGTHLQSCSREMKAAAYGSLQTAGVLFNYDLSSSHARICNYYEFPRYGIECPWLEEYLASKENRKKCVERVGIPDDLWKECFSGLLMGASLKDSIRETLEAELSGAPETVAPIIARLQEVTADLMPALRKWHQHLAKKLAQEGSIQNRLGISLTKAQLSGRSKRGKIAAHILQGTEAFFIHTLTTLGKKHGFKPLGNEHDGLITEGEIPLVAIEEAKAQTGLHHLELLPKPFG